MLEIKLITVKEDIKNVISEDKLKELSLFSLSEGKKCSGLLFSCL